MLKLSYTISMDRNASIRKTLTLVVLLLMSAGISLACLAGTPDATPSVPHERRWGIYRLDPQTQAVTLLYSAETEISTLRLNPAGDTLLFAQRIGGEADENSELCTVGTGGEGFTRLTENASWDLYPAWSPDGRRIAFLSLRRSDLDLYVMDRGGGGEALLFDSGEHDADPDWQAGRIVFTSGSRIWIMDEDGTNAAPVSDPPRGGEWGQANLPFGDYDPRLSPDGRRIVFERLVGDSSLHGNYDLFLIHPDGTGETRLTDTGYSQGLASWSHSGDRLLYIVSAVDGSGQFDMYMLNTDGSGNENVTPTYFPAQFLVHEAIFAADDADIFFIGEWWERQ